ncbi:MAG: dihydrofolate reductase [Myxococcota bacterium]
MLIAAMVAADRTDGIARGGDLPWRLPGDLRRMKVMTTGSGKNAVLMGRTTFLTLPCALPKRLNLVLTRRADLSFAGAVAVPSWSAALAAARAAGAPELWVLGGAEVYGLALAQPELTRIELTRIDGDFGCDVHWPGVPAGFALAEASDWRVEGGTSYRYERWERSSGVAPAP